MYIVIFSILGFIGIVSILALDFSARRILKMILPKSKSKSLKLIIPGYSIYRFEKLKRQVKKETKKQKLKGGNSDQSS